MVASIIINIIVDFTTRLVDDFWRHIDKGESYAYVLGFFHLESSNFRGTIAENLPVDPVELTLIPA